MSEIDPVAMTPKKITHIHSATPRNVSKQNHEATAQSSNPRKNKRATSIHPIRVGALSPPNSPRMATAPSTPDRSSSASSPAASSSNPPSKFLAALSTINPTTDFANLTTYPCARYSLLFGITAGFSVGLLRFLFSTRRTGLRIPTNVAQGSVKQGGNTAAMNAGAAAREAGTAEGIARGKGKGRGWEEVGNASNWAVGAFGVASLGAWCVHPLRNPSWSSSIISRFTRLLHDTDSLNTQGNMQTPSDNRSEPDDRPSPRDQIPSFENESSPLVLLDSLHSRRLSIISRTDCIIRIFIDGFVGTGRGDWEWD